MHTGECLVLGVRGFVRSWFTRGPAQQQCVGSQASDSDALDERVQTSSNLEISSI